MRSIADSLYFHLKRSRFQPTNIAYRPYSSSEHQCPDFQPKPADFIQISACFSHYMERLLVCNLTSIETRSIHVATRHLIRSYPFSAIIADGLWLARQWVAAQFDYDPYLRPQWFSVFDTPLYHLWRLFEWWYAFHAYAPEIFRTGGKIVAGATFACIFSAALLSVWRGRRAKKPTTFGASDQNWGFS
ncbi:MAG: hypothetical protein OXC62_13470 [Aestuariivita sp.]|nr:hypothetical protein [Aestuariivita sp.]